jgi:hypothetical protein
MFDTIDLLAETELKSEHGGTLGNGFLGWVGHLNMVGQCAILHRY